MVLNTKTVIRYLFAIFAFVLFFEKNAFSQSETGNNADVNAGNEPVEDSLEVQKPVSPYRPTYEPKDRYGDPFTNKETASPLFLDKPSNYKIDYDIDTANNYTIYENVGEMDYRPPAFMSFEEYSYLKELEMLKQYWQQRSAGLDGESAVSGRRLIPPIYISPVFDRIFGGSYVDIQPNGYVNLDFGGRWQRTHNPSLSLAQQKTGGFEFDMQMSMNLVGTVGEKLKVTANFDNNNAFDFQNDMKVEYTGFDEEIIKKIEVGNVSLGVNNSLINGAQNLFGLKTQLQFGRLYVTAVAATQRGKTESVSINANGDAQGRNFEIRVSDYDENRHFFLGHFFKDHYNEDNGWLKGYPQVTSGLTIKRLNVYLINNNNTATSLRKIVAFTDLAEADSLVNSGFNPRRNGAPTDNKNNDIFQRVQNDPSARDESTVHTALQSMGMESEVDYLYVNSARKLERTEYYINERLGYVSLNRRLQNNEMLAVGYEYTYYGPGGNGIYTVGELEEDLTSGSDTKIMFLKLLKPRKIDTQVHTWHLMMKNVYSMNVSEIKKDGFELKVLYRDDRSGITNPTLQEGAQTKGQQLVHLMGADELNQNGDRTGGDGLFDYVENVTVIKDQGLIVFPRLEPFGKDFEELFVDGEEALVSKYVYDDLYTKPKAEAELNTNKNKFLISGKVSGSGASNEITLPGINIAENSVVVMAGGTRLVEGTDYRVDYNLGKVTILNPSVMNSGKEITVTYEKSDLFNFQSRTLLGTRLDYVFSDDFNIGATLLYLNERPAVSRIGVGEETLRNVKYGFDVNYKTESRFLTRMMDALPVVSTKEMSYFQFNGEFAQLIPGTSNKVNGEGTAYIDDFEGTAIPYSLGSSPQSWKLASTPKTAVKNKFNHEEMGLPFNYKRAKVSWFIIDNIFYRNSSSQKPGNITSDDLENHYVRSVQPQEIYPNRDKDVINNNLPVFNIAYFPSERGPNNYTPVLDQNGLLNNPEDNWGGIMRAITNEVDFDKSNIEYIEFWMMDPFITGVNGVVKDGIFNQNNTTGGHLVFNLGAVSEDRLKDNRHSYENGLSPDGSSDGMDESGDFRVPKNGLALTPGFDNNTAARQYQDVGLDGYWDEEERRVYVDFLNAHQGKSYYNELLLDPSGDNFSYFLGADHDENDHKIIRRYKDFNQEDGNSPVGGANSYTQTPDNEDIDNDNTISNTEDFYEYVIDLKPGKLDESHKYIVGKQNTNGADWYLFRIPIRKPDNRFGNINGYKNIRFIRTYLTQFKQPVVLRMVDMKFVGAQWRGMNQEYQGGDVVQPSQEKTIEISVVNLEDNPEYVLPPGIERDYDNTSAITRQNNEQSMQLCVQDMPPNTVEAAYKNVSLDLVNYGRVKMFLHAHSPGDEVYNKDPMGNRADGTGYSDVKAFLRFGTDFDRNYYEIEVPLKMTLESSMIPGADPYIIWPEENNIDISFNELYELKSIRDRSDTGYDLPFSQEKQRDDGSYYKLTIVGRPQISTLETIMIGMKNPAGTMPAKKNLCLWANELRVTDFDSEAGWAANARMTTKLADVATVNASTQYVSSGFGTIQQRVSERTREESLSYDVNATVNLDKFGPDRLGFKIPMYVSYEKSVVTPKYDPYDNDIPLKAVLNSFDTEGERQDYLSLVQDRTQRRAINFSNVRKEKRKEDAVSRFFDIENFTMSFAYSEINRTSYNVAGYNFKDYRGTLTYNYNPQGLSVEPFKNIGFLQSPFLQLIRDFNFSPVPSSIGFTADIDRRYVETQLREADNSLSAATYEKYFYFNRNYNLRWDLSKGLSMNYNSRVNSVVDEPEGAIDSREDRDEIISNLLSFGRMQNFDQQIALNYRLPLDKTPLTDWTNVDASYAVGYTWQSGPINQDPEFDFGHTIQNNRQYGITGKLDFVKLYNKNKYLKSINAKKRRRTSSRSNSIRKTSTAAKDSTENKSSITDSKTFKGAARFLMMLRSINVNYNVNEGTLLPGFNKRAYLFGADSSFSAPGWDFILGSQDPNIRYDAARNGWVVDNPNLATPFTQTRNIDLNIKTNIEPVKNFRIKLDFRKQSGSSYQEIFRADTLGNYSSLSPSRSGNYMISFMPIRTAFVKSGTTSATFEEFERNLDIIERRQNELQESSENEIFGNKHQDVLIPAFLAAYTGKSAESANLSPFPRFPMPNWDINYSGLRDIPALSKIFSSINIKHAYMGTYSVSSFTSNLIYTEQEGGGASMIDMSKTVEDYPRPTLTKEVQVDDGNGNLETKQMWMPVYTIDQVVISERFQPLIGIDLRTKSKISARVEYSLERNVALSISNAQVAEMNSNDISFDFGYTKAGLKLPFKFGGRTVVLDNDLTLRMKFTVRDTQSVQRRIKEGEGESVEEDVITSGNVNYQVRPTLSYLVNQRLNLQMYYEHTINEPKVSQQFKRTTSSFGVQVRFSLAQ
ncbi:T9SS outer membrane translocon Sov/SprA [Aureibacter tunicatorum]|uniref:Cell surface protein SprA n=1 Tax=Aureibacter tunicatorum TaxID=866807 RepID=A0AAE3XKL7_9BACT|nr:cell surface protein SprA [Aureibacter tunicatorum]MDR6237734.1 cell surface protein SprA [Aureibacter tunicatorum]BDD02769.1 cell surface protein SprA [Aureibacter tunicatorum]